MAEFGVEGPALKKMIAKAKDAPVAFGFNPGKTDEDAYLAMHPKKSAEVVGKDAKEQGDGNKFAFGTAVLVDKELRLTCGRELPGLSKRLKKFLKNQKVMLNVVVYDADGNVLESDIEDDLPDDPELASEENPSDAEDEAGPPSGSDTPQVTAGETPVAPPAPDAAALMKRLQALRDQIGKLAPDAQARVVDPFKQLVELVKGNQLVPAATGIDRLEKAIGMLAGQAPQAEPQVTPPPDPQFAKLTQMVEALRKRADALTDPAMKTRILGALDVATGHIKALDAVATVAILKRLQEAFKTIDAQNGAQEVPPAPPKPEGVSVAGNDNPNENEQENENENEDDALGSPEKQEWDRRFGAIEGDVYLAMSQGQVEELDKFRLDVSVATESADLGDYAKALSILPRIEAALSQGRADGGSAFLDEVPPDAKPFAEARIRWANARGTMRSEVQKIVASIEREAAEDEDLAEAAANVSVLTNEVAKIDSRLEDALDKIVNAVADARDPLKGAARKLISEYEGQLQQPFFQDIDMNSGFGSVAVTSTARAALADIARVLA